MIGLGRWYAVKQTDPRAVALYQRHYSAKKGNRQHGITGPGETLTLLTDDVRALFVWRTEAALGDDYGFVGHPDAIACGVFRNEGDDLSSALVREADELADVRWPHRPRHYTWVDPKSIKPTQKPGWCFRKAGWRDTKVRSLTGLVLLARPATPQPQGTNDG